MPNQPHNLLVDVDASGDGVGQDCLDCLVAFPVAIDRMRAEEDVREIPLLMASRTRDSFSAYEEEGGDFTSLAIPAIDKLYRNITQLTVLDAFTEAYVGIAVREYFDQLSNRNLIAYYVLDNALRQDRFMAVIELFQVAGIAAITPHTHGLDWAVLSDQINLAVNKRSHVAYIEPDATVNHIDSATNLGRELDRVCTFRNLAPEDPRISVLNMS